MAEQQVQFPRIYTIQRGEILKSVIASAVVCLVIDLAKLLTSAPQSEDDVALRDGDRMRLPRYQRQVTVIGEVQSLTSQQCRAQINQRGGVTQHANVSRIYVARANGAVVVANTGENSAAWVRMG